MNINKYKSLLLLGILLLASHQPIKAQFFPQESHEPDFQELSIRERIFVGGFIGLQFGTQTAINISPLAGFRITERLSAGMGGTYQYFNDRWLGESYVTHVYGGSLFARFRVVSRLFLHAEHEWLNIRSGMGVQNPADQTRIWEKNPLLGAGWSQPMGPRVRLNIKMLYNFNENSRAYYTNPIWKVGVDVSL